MHSMNSLFIFSCIIAVSLAFPLDIAEVYLTEDTSGNYKLNFKSKAISREEERTADGSVLGSYTFVDPEGAEHKVIYVAAPEKGYIANSADIPKPVPENPELVVARNNHLAAVAEEQAKFPHGIPEEKPVPLSEVLAKLVLPEIATLPAEAVPAEGADAAHAKAELLNEYSRILTQLAEEYTRLHH